MVLSGDFRKEWGADRLQRKVRISLLPGRR